MKKLQPITDRTSAAELIDAAEKAADGLQVKQREKIADIIKNYRRAVALLPVLPLLHAVTKKDGAEFANVRNGITADGAELYYKSGNGWSWYNIIKDGATLGRFIVDAAYNGAPQIRVIADGWKYEDAELIPLTDPAADAYNVRKWPADSYRGEFYAEYGNKRLVLTSAQINERLKDVAAGLETYAARQLAQIAAIPAAVDFIQATRETIKSGVDRFGFESDLYNTSVQYLIKEAFGNI